MISYSKTIVRIDLAAVRHNYRVLARSGSRLVAVVKADAYGHGLGEVALALEAEGADSFGVGYVHEGERLRQAGCRGRILNLLGPVDKDDMARLAHGDIIPFITHFETLQKLVAQIEKPIDIALKFDTGMSRLGFRPEDVPALLEFFHKNKCLRPVMAASHFAASDEPSFDSVTQKQHALFSDIVSSLRQAGHAVEANISNSAATLGYRESLWDSQRTGIALYGVNPFGGTSKASLGKDIRNTMSAHVPVLHIHTLRKGQGISYGHTHVAKKDCTVAVIGVGYADGYSRGLSNKGFMSACGIRVPVLGRVCMQMTCVDISALPAGQLQVGDRVHILGGHGEEPVHVCELAEWWGTIPYEVLCLIGMGPREFTE